MSFSNMNGSRLHDSSRRTEDPINNSLSRTKLSVSKNVFVVKLLNLTNDIQKTNNTMESLNIKSVSLKISANTFLSKIFESRLLFRERSETCWIAKYFPVSVFFSKMYPSKRWITEMYYSSTIESFDSNQNSCSNLIHDVHRLTTSIFSQRFNLSIAKDNIHFPNILRIWESILIRAG